MERPATPSPSSSPPLKHLSPLEWETFIDDHQYGGHRRDRWTYTASSLLDLFLSSILRKDIPLNLKLNITVFLEEFFPADDFSQSGIAAQALTRLLEALRSLIQSPNDGISITFSIKDQLLLSTTSIFITSGAINVDGTPNSDYTTQLEGLIELLLTVINRPNHGVDRQTRGVACECLRELERECPSLLSQVAGHLWGLCQSERTHVAQSYVLLLATVIHGIVSMKSNVSIFNTSIPLVPFNAPQFLNGSGKEISTSTYKELRRAMSFLLEWPHNLTSFGLIEFMSVIMPVAVALELQPSLLKVQFSGLLYTYDVLLCHAYLRMHLHFLDSFDGQESEIAGRLVLIARETQHHLVFRLLALHWLLSFMGLMSNGDIVKEKSEKMNLWFYPTVFDPLALKSLKLDLLAYCPILLNKSRLADANGVAGQAVDSGVSVVKLFEDGLVSVSGFKWLPSWSTETAVAFRTFHKFLIGASCHSDSDSSSTSILMDSTIFHTLERMLVDVTLEFQGLVPVIVAFISRLLGCSKHRCLGERLLQTFDEYLLPKVQIDYRLGSYFPIFEKIAENDTVPPGGLLEILTKFMMILVKKHGPDTGLKSWSHGSKVLSLSRTMLMHHHSSRLFLGLSRLLAFTCIYYPDLEVRDSSRIYLRMLICVPGKKLRGLLNAGDEVNGISPSSHSSSSYFNLQSPRVSSHVLKKSRNISSYIHLERLVPLLVKQSWSLSLLTMSIHDNQPSGYLESIKDNDSPSGQKREVDSDTNHQVISQVDEINREPLRVMDSKISEIVGILRMHFSSIPDFRHVSGGGLKIKLYCSLRFESEPFSKVWGGVVVGSHSNNVSNVPPPPAALYATVLTFSSSAPYGAIPSYHIPFLLGGTGHSDSSLAIVSLENGGSREEELEEEEEEEAAHVLVELEPREPIPGIVNVSIETNTENGEIIHGNLDSISVGIEDMFLKAIVPDEIKGDDKAVAGYYVDLFNALWEACGNCSSTGRETFPLKGGGKAAVINGTRSVKLLEVGATCLVEAVERNLSAFVVSVIGDPLINMVRDGGIIRDVIWKKSTFSDSTVDDNSGTNFSEAPLPLYIKYGEEEEEEEEEEEDGGGSSNVGGLLMSKKKVGSFQILIFLPPRFHLLFEMEVSENSTLVRIRTDHWPCLAYIDDFLEALFFAA